MDKPLDFSMNACKDDKSIGNESKPNEEIRYVPSKEQETLHINVYAAERNKTEKIKNDNQDDEKICNEIKDELKSCILADKRSTAINTSFHKRALPSNTTLDSASKETIPMPPHKQMPPLHYSSSERTGIASKLLKDIIQLQATQNAQAKVSLEKQINALRENELFVKQNLQNIQNLNEVSWKNSTSKSNQKTSDYNEQTTETNVRALVDIDMVNDNESKIAQDESEEVKEFGKDKGYRQASYNDGILFPPNNLNNQHLQSLSSAVIGGTSNVVGEHRQEASTAPPTQQQQVPISSELHRVNQDSLRNYAAFRDNMLRHFAITKLRRRQSATNSLDNEDDDDCNYVERRKKNNEAAKRSRDARRAKEDEVSIRAAFLEQENIQLKWDVTKLRAEVAKIRAYVIAEAAIDFQLQQQTHQMVGEKDVT